MFLIFPEYDEVEKTSEHVREICILPSDEILDYVKLLDTLDRRGRAEHYKLYFDRKNIANFLYPVHELSDYYPPLENSVLLSLNKIAENWREDSCQDNRIEYKLFHKKISNDTFCEMCERKYREQSHPNDSTFAIINHNGLNLKPKSGAIEVTRDGQPVELTIINGAIDEIESWLQTHRRPLRRYNWNPKHGVNGHGAHDEHKNNDVAVLYCSIEHATMLLHEAIGEDADNGPLYVWDDDFNRFMEFKRESKNCMTFHSYHLENDDRKIPQIAKLLKK